MSQPNQKQLKFNPKNMLIAFGLLTVLNIVGPTVTGIDPTTDLGRGFYFFAALATAFMFPFLEVKDVDSKDKTPES